MGLAARRLQQDYEACAAALRGQLEELQHKVSGQQQAAPTLRATAPETTGPLLDTLAVKALERFVKEEGIYAA